MGALEILFIIIIMMNFILADSNLISSPSHFSSSNCGLSVVSAVVAEKGGHHENRGTHVIVPPHLVSSANSCCCCRCCLMSSDVGRRIRDNKLRPMREHGLILLYVHGNRHKAR